MPQPSMLVAYNAAGEIIATLDHMVARDDDGELVGLVDFAGHEAAGGELTDIWTVEGAKGSKTWPEFLGGRAHEFRVELAGSPGQKQLAALVHRSSGVRRERADVERAIRTTPLNDAGELDIRHVVGGPTRPIQLDEDGRTTFRAKPPAPPARLPVLGRAR